MNIAYLIILGGGMVFKDRHAVRSAPASFFVKKGNSHVEAPLSTPLLSEAILNTWRNPIIDFASKRSNIYDFFGT